MKRGFSLVELSIVLVILGLLVGGVLVGRSLIRAAELRAVPTEFERYTAATYGFFEKYGQYPGDINNITRYFGHMTAGNNCANTTGTAINATNGVCDGNGDGMVRSTIADDASETFQAWRHLAVAGYIEGAYTGIANSTHGLGVTVGSNVPSSKVPEAIWMLWFVNTNSSVMFFNNFGNSFTLSKPHSGSWPTLGVMSVEEAWSLDTKMDDGHAGRGKVWAIRWDDCTTAGSNTDFQNYDMANTARNQCGLIFNRIF